MHVTGNTNFMVVMHVPCKKLLWNPWFRYILSSHSHQAYTGAGTFGMVSVHWDLTQWQLFSLLNLVCFEKCPKKCFFPCMCVQPNELSSNTILFPNSQHIPIMPNCVWNHMLQCHLMWFLGVNENFLLFWFTRWMHGKKQRSWWLVVMHVSCKK